MPPMPRWRPADRERVWALLQSGQTLRAQRLILELTQEYMFEQWVLAEHPDSFLAARIRLGRAWSDFEVAFVRALLDLGLRRLLRRLGLTPKLRYR